MKIPSTLLDPNSNQLTFILYALIIITTGLIAPILLHTFALQHSRPLTYLLGQKKK
jgi:hypothetical protein